MSDETSHDEVEDALPGLLTGDLDRDRTREVLRHLRDCPTCTGVLTDLVAAHAALASARRAMAGPDSRPGPGSTTDDDGRPLPPLRRVPRLRPLALAGVAAVLVIALALGASALTGHWPASSGSAAVATRSVDLVPVPEASGPAVPGAAGRVSMTGAPGAATTDMAIRTSGLPTPAPGHFYYAWLLDPTTNKMLPLGVVPARSPARFVVASALVARYAAVDISLQADDGDPAHSATSVLRASYAG